MSTIGLAINDATTAARAAVSQIDLSPIIDKSEFDIGTRVYAYPLPPDRSRIKITVPRPIVQQPVRVPMQQPPAPQ